MTTFWTVVTIIVFVYFLLSLGFAYLIRSAPQLEDLSDNSLRPPERGDHERPETAVHLRPSRRPAAF